jgi:hypothetical protein
METPEFKLKKKLFLWRLKEDDFENVKYMVVKSL